MGCAIEGVGEVHIFAILEYRRLHSTYVLNAVLYSLQLLRRT